MTIAAMQGADGLAVRLRLIAPDDAAYITSLRVDPRYNRHLSPVTGNVDDQRTWIERYKHREAEGTEFYYVIDRLSDGTCCLALRLYEIEADRFTWGSWILDENKPAKAALESAVLSFGLGFDVLDKPLALIDVRKANLHAGAFYRRFGMQEVGEDADNFYFHFDRARFEQDRPGYTEVLRQAYQG